MKKSLFHKLFILLFALPALACGLFGEDPTPTVIPTEAAAAPTDPPPTDTPLPPTDTPEPPADTPEPTAETNISADFVTLESPELGLSIQHPADWVSEDFFVLIIASSQEVLDSPDTPEEGAAMILLTGSTDELGADNPADLLEVGLEEFDLGENYTIVDGPNSVVIQGQDAVTARIEGSAEDTEVELVGLAVAIVEGDYAAFGLGFTPQETEEEYLPIFEAMINSMILSEPTGVDPEFPLDPLTLAVGDNFASTLEEDTPLDFILTGQANSPITIQIDPIDDGLDLVMELFDTDLNSLERVDDAFTDEAEILIFSPPADGQYYLRVEEYYGEAGGFIISVTQGSALAPTDVTPLAAGQVVLGRLDGEPVNYIVSGEAGVPAAIIVVPEEDMDPNLTIVSTEGVVLAEENDAGFSGEFEGISYTPEVDGDIVVIVDAFGLAEGDYAIYLMDPDTAFTAEGTIELGGGQEYRVCVPGGNAPIVFVNPEEGFDPFIKLLGADGSELTRQVDRGASGDAEFAVLTDEESSDEDYPVIISIWGFGGQGGSFTLWAASTSPDGVVLDGC
jgi:hypothetical protein